MTALADVEAALAWVLTEADLGAPVYGELPPEPAFPCVRLVRVAGAPPSTAPLFLDEAMVQLDAFALGKGAARSISDKARMALALVANTRTPFGLLAGVQLGVTAYEPDDTRTPVVARYRTDFTAWARTIPTAAATP